jgi:hypothetical protein
MFEKTLIIVSLNVRGMKVKKTKPKHVKAWLSSLPTPPQVILLRSTTSGRWKLKTLLEGLSYGRANHTGMRVSQWDAPRESVPEWRYWWTK